MFKRTRVLAVSAAVSVMFSQAIAQETDANTVVASVNGTDITIGHMIVLRNGLPEQYQSLPPQVLFDGILEQLVQQSVLAQTMSTTSRAIELRLENEKRSLMAGEAMSAALDGVVTEEALQAAYDDRFADAEATQEYNASHILVESEEEAIALVAELEAGADFAESAKAKSTGPSGPNGGELGWFGAGMMVKPFEDAVTTMDVGAISAPVQTQFGWHVIKLNDSRIVEGPPMVDVRQELSEELQQKAIEAALAELKAAADISLPDVSAIDPAVLNQFELIQK